MEKPLRRSRKSRSLQSINRLSTNENILSFTSETDENTRRNSKWWKHLSDNSIRKSFIAYRNRNTKANDVLESDSSYSGVESDKEWWKQLSQDEFVMPIDAVLQLKQNVKRNTEHDETNSTHSDSDSKHESDIIVKRKLFTGRELRSQKHRFSKAFNKNEQASTSTQILRISDGDPDEDNIENVDSLIDEINDDKRKRIFGKKSEKRKFSDAFNWEPDANDVADENTSDKELQRGNENLETSEILRKNRNVSEAFAPLQDISQQSLEAVNDVDIRKNTQSQGALKQDKLATHSQTEEKTTRRSKRLRMSSTSNAPETSEAASKINADLGDTSETTESKTLFKTKRKQTRNFSEAFSKSKQNDPTLVNLNETNTQLHEHLSEEKEDQGEKVDTKRNKTLSKEELKSKKLSEAFTTTKSTGTPLETDDLNPNDDMVTEQQVTKDVSRKNVADSSLRRSSRKRRKSSTSTSENKETSIKNVKEDVKQKDEIIIEEIEDNSQSVSKKKPSSKGRKQSKSLNKTKNVTASLDNKNDSEVLQNETLIDQKDDDSAVSHPKKSLFNEKLKKNRKFSEAFALSKNVEASLQDVDENTEVINEPNFEENEAGVQKKESLFKKELKKKRQFSEAFALSKNVEASLQDVDENTEVINEPNFEENEAGVQKKESLFKKELKKKRQFSEAFALSKNVEASLQDVDENTEVINEPNFEENEADDQTKKSLFKKQLEKRRQFSEAFALSKNVEASLKDVDENTEVSNEQSVEENEADARKEKSLFKKESKKSRKFSEAFALSKNTEAALEYVHETTEENNEQNVEENDSGVKAKKSLFREKSKIGRKFSEAFDLNKSVQKDSDVDEDVDDLAEEQNDVEYQEEVVSTRDKNLSRKISNDNEDLLKNVADEDAEENVNREDNRQKLFEEKLKKNRKFSEAFSKSNNIEVSAIDVAEEDVQQMESLTRQNEDNEEKLELRSKKALNPDKLEKSRNFSVDFSVFRKMEASAENIKILDNNDDLLQDIKNSFINFTEKNKSFGTEAVNIITEKPNQELRNFENVGKIINKNVPSDKEDISNSLSLSPISSINDTTDGQPKKLLFRGKSRKSLFSRRSLQVIEERDKLTSNQQQITEQKRLTVEGNNTVNTGSISPQESVTRWFENSLISSTKLNFTTNKTGSDGQKQGENIRRSIAGRKSNIIEPEIFDAIAEEVSEIQTNTHKRDLVPSNQSLQNVETSIPSSSKATTAIRSSKIPKPIQRNTLSQVDNKNPIESNEKSALNRSLPSTSVRSSNVNEDPSKVVDNLSELGAPTPKNYSEMFFSSIHLTPKQQKDEALGEKQIVSANKEQVKRNKLLKLIKPSKASVVPNENAHVQIKKITDFFAKISSKEPMKISPKKKLMVSQKTLKPVGTARLIDGKIYRPRKLFHGKRWCNPRFYKYLQKKMRNKYEDDTINESENLMKFIAESVTTVIKTKKYLPKEINRMKKELARNEIISTTYDFYRFVEEYLPDDYREKVVPTTRAYTAEPTVPYDHATLFEKIAY